MIKSKINPNYGFGKNKKLESYIPTLFNVSSLTILIILVVLLEKEAIPVHRQGFFCNDNSIKFPYQKEETVPGKWMFGINYGLSIILYLIGETCFYRQSPHNENQNEEVSTPRKSNCQLLKRISKLIFSLTWCMAATLMITSVIKSTVGSLRPHFMDVCTPNVDCTQYSNDIYVLNYTCQANKDHESQKIVEEARRSFPSGHSSFSAAVMGFNILYIQLRYKFSFFWVNCNRNFILDASAAYLRLFLQILSIGVACFIAMSRVMDYYHHMVDVIAGFLLGTIIGLLVGQHCMKWLRKSFVISHLKKYTDVENADGDKIIQEMESLKESD